MTRRGFLVGMGAALTAGAGFAQLPGAIEGQVLTAEGKPAVNATVVLDSETRRLHRRAQASASGQYSFEDLMPGQYTLWCELDGHGCIVYPNLAVNAGARLKRDFHFATRSRNCEV